MEPHEMEVEMTSSDPSASSRLLLSPPLSPFLNAELPVIPTDDLGMIADDERPSEGDFAQSAAAAAAGKPKKKTTVTRRKITYVSRHFVADGSKDEQNSPTASKRSQRGEKQPTEVKAKRRRPGQRQQRPHDDETMPTLATPPVTPARLGPRIYYGLNVDDLSSDSSLTDVPDDLGPDPFSPQAGFPSPAVPEEPPPSTVSPSEVQAIKVTTKKPKTSRRPTRSPYFPHPHKQRPTFLSTLPFPPLSHSNFGLMQERLAHNPFRLLIATIFLNKTPGERAMPIFYQLMSRYPTPADLAEAEVSDITSIIYGLGFQNQRAKKCVAMAKVWVENPPERGKRYRKLNYPCKGDGRDIRDEEVLGDDEQDGRVAWEISHLPGLGPYSHDSWRIFCRDELRRVGPQRDGREDLAGKTDAEVEGDSVDAVDRITKEKDPAGGGNDKGTNAGQGNGDEKVTATLDLQPMLNPTSEAGRVDADIAPAAAPSAVRGIVTSNGPDDQHDDQPEDEDETKSPRPNPPAQPIPFEPEWKRVVPTDKELRAYLTWKWLQEGWIWNKETGARTRAPESLLAEARGGGIVIEERDSDHLVVKGVDETQVDQLQHERTVERTAGDYLPDEKECGNENGNEDQNGNQNDDQDDVAIERPVL